MTATNHVLTGAIIGASIANPLLALPLALLSHLLLDVLPHFGRISHLRQKFLYILVADMAIAAGVLGTIFVLQPENWFLIISCGVIAASPDLLWFPYWLVELRGKKLPGNSLTRFLGWIQWGERPWGMLIEIPFGIMLAAVLAKIAFI